MIWLENEFGWRLHKNKIGYVIRRAHPPLSRRISQFGPLFLSLFYAAFLWLVGDNEKLRIALFVIPLSLILGYYLFRPAVLYINVRQRIVMGGDLFPRLPFSRFKIEIDHNQDTGRWRVYLKDTEPLWNTSKWQSGKWECLAWESGTEAEASKIADEFRLRGIGMESAQGQGQAIKMIRADKRIRMLVLFGYLVSVIIFTVLIGWILSLSEVQPKQVEPEVLLRFIQIVIAFIFLSILPFGVYLCLFGWRVIKSRQMPPPGTKVIFDTKVLEGDKAVTRGRLIIAISLMLIVLGLFGGLYFPYKLEKVYGGQISPTIPKAVSEN